MIYLKVGFTHFLLKISKPISVENMKLMSYTLVLE